MVTTLKLVEKVEPDLDLDAVNRRLADAPPEAILEWARETFGNRLVLTSSFGAESAVMLHLTKRSACRRSASAPWSVIEASSCGCVSLLVRGSCAGRRRSMALAATFAHTSV